MLRLRHIDGVSPEYLFAYLSSRVGQAQVAHLSTTTSGLRNLQVKRYLDLPIPLPDEQQRDELDELASNSNLLHKRLVAAGTALDELYQVRVHEYLGSTSQ